MPSNVQNHFFWGGPLYTTFSPQLLKRGALKQNQGHVKRSWNFHSRDQQTKVLPSCWGEFPRWQGVCRHGRVTHAFLFTNTFWILFWYTCTSVKSPKKYQDQQKGNPCFSRQWRWSWEFPHIGVYKPPLGRQIFKWLRYQSCRFERVGWYKRMHLRQPGPLQHLRSRYHRMSVYQYTFAIQQWSKNNAFLIVYIIIM